MSLNKPEVLVATLTVTFPVTLPLFADAYDEYDDSEDMKEALAAEMEAAAMHNNAVPIPAQFDQDSDMETEDSTANDLSDSDLESEDEDQEDQSDEEEGELNSIKAAAAKRPRYNLENLQVIIHINARGSVFGRTYQFSLNH